MNGADIPLSNAKAGKGQVWPGHDFAMRNFLIQVGVVAITLAILGGSAMVAYMTWPSHG